jgi:D-sedoheptulose 7-phosphate isomerase
MPNSYPEQYRTKLIDTIAHIDTAKVQRAIDQLAETRDAGRCIFVCGNGGSASTASHFACDMVKGASYNRDKRFKIMALTDQMATITAYANDVSYDLVFVEQLRNFAQKGDLLLAISGSGNSPNVLRAVAFVNAQGGVSCGLTGYAGGKLATLATHSVIVPSDDLEKIEDCHMILCHLYTAYLRQELALG